MPEHFKGGNLKSAAKLLILDLYVKPYSDIMEQNWGDYWYVDTHAGTGKHQCANNAILDGSALRVIKNWSDKFDRFYLYEVNPSRFNLLVETLANEVSLDFDKGPVRAPDADFPVARCNDPYIRVMQTDSNQGVSLLSSWNDSAHWLTFIDPRGLTVRRDTLERLTERGNMDILLNFPTDGVLRNIPEGASHSDESLENLLGEGIPDEISAEKSLEAIKRILTQNEGWEVKSKNMKTTMDGGHRFDLVFASANDTGISIMDWIMNEKDDLWEEASQMIGQPGLGTFI